MKQEGWGAGEEQWSRRSCWGSPAAQQGSRVAHLWWWWLTCGHPSSADLLLFQTHQPHRGERAVSPVPEGHPGGKVCCCGPSVGLSQPFSCAPPVDLARALPNTQHPPGRQQDRGAVLSLPPLRRAMRGERLRLSAAAAGHAGETPLGGASPVFRLLELAVCVSDGECVPGVSTLLLPVPGQYPGG